MASADEESSGSGASTPAPRPRYPPFDARVHGVLYKLRAEDLAKLAKKEGGYVIKEIEVRGGGSGWEGGSGSGYGAVGGSSRAFGPPPRPLPAPDPAPARRPRPQVETYDGRRVLAQTFVSGPMAMLPAEVAPTEKYMRALREGAADNYLDPLHQVGGAGGKLGGPVWGGAGEEPGGAAGGRGGQLPRPSAPGGGGDGCGWGWRLGSK
jgi:hypothetical protein